MKNLGIAVMVVCFVAVCVANASAQAPLVGAGPFGVPLSTGPGDTRVVAGWFGPNAETGPTLFAPRLFAAWSPNSSSIKLAGTGSAYGDASNNAYGEGAIQWSTNGLWLGLSLPVQINSRLSTDLQAWYFFPGQKYVEVFGRGSELDGGNPSSGNISGNLNIDTTWFAVDLEGSYRTSADFAILAGVRYDYLQGTISLPESLGDIIIGAYPALRSKLDINLNSIFPYVGLRSRYSTAQGSLTFSVKGFPWAISVADVQPESGYFAELFCSYDVVPSSDFSLSLFAKVDIARAVFNDFSKVTNVFNKDPAAPQDVLLDQSLPITWQQYLIGGVATLRFGLGFL